MADTETVAYFLDEDAKDLRSDVKVTIGTYMSEKLRVNVNKPDSGLVDTVQNSDKPITAGGQSDVFASGDTHPQLETVSDSGVIFKPTISSYMKKGTDGMTLLPSVDKDHSNATAVYPVAQYLETLPTSPNNHFFVPGKTPKTGARLQATLGTYDVFSEEVTEEILKSIGDRLTMVAAGDFQFDGSITENKRSVISRASVGQRRFPVSNFLVRGEAGLAEETRTTFGVQNSSREPFEGSESMSDLATEMVMALKDAVAGQISGVEASSAVGSDSPPLISVLRPGIRTSNEPGIRKTRHDFAVAVTRGFDIFFGLSSGKYTQPTIEPGFYSIVAKMVINVLSRPTESLVNSRSFSVLNVFAGIGDHALDVEDAGQNATTSKSLVDTMEDGPTTRIAKSRDRNMSLAWRTSVLPSAYLLPDQVITAYETFTGKKGSRLLAGAAGEKIVLGTGNRISAAHVQKIEIMLDSEYVPFYFHDLRTNEIVAFHAFLESLSDSYKVDYESTDAYGRVDPVMVYSKTNRNISVEFSVVATNPADFDEMWWKINKLTTLLYPQWSSGRQVSTSDGKFIQPFSQIPSASPLIRLRLGDVLKSNYSRFNLARIFGLGTSNFDLGTTIESADLNSEQVTLVRSRMSQDPAVVGFSLGGFKMGEQAYLQPEPTGTGWQSVNGTELALTTTNSILVTFSDDGTLTTTSDGVTYTLYKVSVTDTEALAAGISPGPYYVTGHFYFTVSDDQVLISAGVEIVDESQDPDQIRSDIQNFFSPDTSATGGGNSIVRSFESTAGKGLAGVITGMDFEWLTATWELGPGFTAPKYCKIKFEFTPIHDIAPGIDSEGFNRAPIYGVGRAVQEISPDIYAERADSEYRLRAFKTDRNRSAQR